MKILITSEWYNPVVNGVVRSIDNLRDGLVKMGHDVKILTMSPIFSSYKKDNVYYLASLDFGKFYPEARQAGIAGIPLINELIRWHPDVIHSQTEFSSFIYARFIANQTKTPQVHTYHTVYEDYTHYFSPSKKIGKKGIEIFSRYILKDIDEIIVPTIKTKNILRKYKLNNPISVIPTGLQIENFRKKITPALRNENREKLGIKNDDWLAIFLGRMAKEKNFDELLNFFKDEENVKLLLVGDGPYKDEVKMKVHQLNVGDRVIFTGMVSPEQVPMYYKISDCFLSASQSETQGLTYIEALASSLPVIARDDPCLVGVVEDGVNGFLYKNEDEFREKFDKLRFNRDIAEQMSKMARRMAFANFSSEKFVESVFEVYERVVNKRRRKYRKRKVN